MDTSKEYMLMCEKAVEIQELKRFMLGDYLCADKYVLLAMLPLEPDGCLQTRMLQGGGHYYVLPGMLSRAIWLPRQDQLQEMVGVKSHRDYLRTVCESGFYKNVAYSDSFDSLEGFWLAFVMK